MEYRKLGNSGLNVSILSFGTGIVKGKDMVPSELEQVQFQYIDMCIKAGVNFFDTAEIYGSGLSEIILGKNLQQGGWDRDEIIISTKLNPLVGGLQGNNRKRMRIGVEQSLKRLQLTNVDLLFLHRIDCHVPLKEQVSTMNEFLESDKTYYWGTSEFTAEELTEVFKICEKYGYAAPICDQCQYNMLHRKAFEVDYAPLFDNYKLGTTVYSPLAGGMLGGRFNNGVIPADSRYALVPMIQYLFKEGLGWRENNGSEMLQELKAIADELGCTQSQLALAWALYNRDVSTALFGASRLEHIADNLGAVSIMHKLDKGILDRIEALLINRPDPPINYRTFTQGVHRR